MARDARRIRHDLRDEAAPHLEPCPELARPEASLAPREQAVARGALLRASPPARGTLLRRSSLPGNGPRAVALLARANLRASTGTIDLATPVTLRTRAKAFGRRRKRLLVDRPRVEARRIGRRTELVAAALRRCEDDLDPPPLDLVERARVAEARGEDLDDRRAELAARREERPTHAREAFDGARLTVRAPRGPRLRSDRTAVSGGL